MKTNFFKKSIWRFPIILTVVLFYMACQKEHVAKQTGSLSTFIEDAKSWFNSRYFVENKKKIIRSSADRLAILGKVLKWDNGAFYEAEGLKYVIVPIDNSMKPLKNRKYFGGRAIVIYQKASDKMQLTIIEAISKEAPVGGRTFGEILQKAFLNKMLNASADVSQTNVNIIFYNGMYDHENSYRFTDGKWSRDKMQIINKKGPSGRNVNLSAISKTVASESNCTTWYTVGIWYDSQTGDMVDYIILNEWTECDDDYVPEYGGGGDQPEEDCTDHCSAIAKSLSEGVQVVSETISINSIPIDPLRKHYNPRWVILKSPTWRLISQEFGIVELIDPVNDTWQWKSLKHGRIEFSGITYGGEVTPSEGIGTPSFTEGTPNVLVAGMSLNFSVKYSPKCNCAGIDRVLPPVTYNYTATAFWPAKPESII